VSTLRDERLGAALRALETPEHRPGFYAELHRLLAEEHAARTAEARRQQRARRARTRWGARVAVVAAVAAAVWLVVGLPENERVPDVIRTEDATAAEIQARVRSALARAETLTGELVVRGRRYRNAYGWDDPARFRFAVTDRGDFRVTGLTVEENVAYDAGKGIQRSLNPSASLGGEGTLFPHVRRGVAPGPPDEGPSDYVLQKDFGAFVRALLAARDPAVRETTYEGRPAWQLEVRAPVNQIVPEFSGDRFAIWVDQETGIPVRIVESKNGRALDELRIEKLAVDGPVPPETFTIDFPKDAEVTRSDSGFRRVGLDEIPDAVGYAPLLPAWLPEGYELAEVAVAPEVATPTGVEGGNPPSRNVVSLSFRRGLDRFLVTTRLRHVPGSGDTWGDPLATGEGFRDRPEQIRLGRGVLSGVEASLLVVPRNIPHLWATTDDLVVTVAGDLSRDELVRVSESLEPRR
jgi:hypothetical protein